MYVFWLIECGDSVYTSTLCKWFVNHNTACFLVKIVYYVYDVHCNVYHLSVKFFSY
jgi:hypothetical protein